MRPPALGLRCPACHAPLPVLPCCGACGFTAGDASGVPVLVADRERIEVAIETARTSGRRAWYEAPQTDQWRGPYRHHLAKRRVYLDAALRRHAPRRGERPIVALDLGCGDGEHLPWLRGWADAVAGSDYNPLRLARAAVHAPEAFLLLADVTNHPGADRSVDLMFFNHVLEHVPDDIAALREVRRMLRPDGVCVLGAPNEGAALWRLAYRLQPSARAASDHVHFYTADALAGRCRAAGLTVREVEHIGWGVPHWKLDAMIRGHKAVDDALERVGRRLWPRQATSLYLILGS
jgi:SAM-dependent methyltransferase